jgi:hypothetical protein
VNRLAGTYTAVPAPGTTISAGHELYRVDDRPVVLMAGAVPAWRPFTLGMSDGPDVGELEANLIALGDASGLLSSPSDHFGVATADAVERWQHALGQTVDGQVALGQVVFEPTPVLVGAQNVAPGQPASPGELPFQVTTTVRTVTVPLNPNLPTVSVGEAVAIVLPTNATTPGAISALGPAPPSGGGSTQAGGSSPPSGVTAIATVTPSDPAATGSGSGVAVQVTLTTQRADHVLAVPVAALLALAGGGYGVEVVDPSGAHRLVGVTTGLFAGTRVAISGSGIHAGTRVVIAQ